VRAFVSQLEQLMPAKELKFKPTPGFGSSYKKFLDHAIAHPAKMNTRLTEFLIKKFTVEGQLILDPMAGSGQTGVIAAVHGRDAVCVDLEQKFYKWMEKARRKVERQQTLAVKGKIRNVCGDARQLSTLLTEADVVVTSPPYAMAGEHRVGYDYQAKDKLRGHKPYLGFRGGYSDDHNNIGNLRHGEIDAVITSPPFSEQQAKHRGGGNIAYLRPSKDGKIGTDKKDEGWLISHNPENIGNLRHGKVDTIITSPPYARDKGGERGMLVHDEKRKNDETLIRTYGENPKNIDNLPFGVDAVITSPPYAESVHANSGAEERGHRLKKAGHNPKDFEGGKARCCEPEWNYGENPENIGNLKFDVAITSPPYENIYGAGRHGEKCRKQEVKIHKEKGLGFPYSKDLSGKQIGNLAKETYLEAMLQVYREMHKVLKPEGKAIIVIKPFIRNKKVVDLPYHTYLLLKQAGFKLTRLFKLRLQNMSFWRILYHKKFANVPQIKHEYVLVTIKTAVLEA